MYMYFYSENIQKQKSNIKSCRSPAFMSIQEATKKGERHVRKPASAGRSNRVLVAVGTPGNAG